MPIKSLSQSSLTNFQKYSSFLAGNAKVSYSSYDLLETEILTGSQASVTFSSLNSTYGSTYQHLQLRVVARTDAASGGGGDVLKMTFNSDTGTNYGFHQLFGFNGNVLSNGENASNQTSIFINRFADAGATANAYGAAVIDILDSFETAKYKTVRYFSGQPNNAYYVFMNSGRWQNTNAIDSINLDPFTASNLVSGTRISLYGLKKAA